MTSLLGTAALTLLSTISLRFRNLQGGTIQDQLATYLWTRLVDVKSLNIHTWFTSQEENTKAYMRAHWTNYCTVIHDECHILYTRMLLNHKPGSQAEIRDVLHTAPPAWNVKTIMRTRMLQLRVALHETTLIAATDIQSSQVVTVSMLPSIIQNMGVASSTPQPFRRFRNPISSSC